jgi:type VI protein secretion system component Hcp
MPTKLFLKFEPEIKGESSQKGYEGQIEVLDFRFGVSQSGGFSFAKGGTRVQTHAEDMMISFHMC